MDIGTAEITFVCPNCEFENTVTLGQVAREETIICYGRMADIQSNDRDSSTRLAIQESQGALAELERTLKKLSR